MSRIPIPNPRNRTINFRLTEKEYDAVKLACGSAGSACLSEFARAAVLAQSADGHSAAPDPPDRPPCTVDSSFRFPSGAKRLRIVTFRVSEEEFDALRALHMEAGTPSVSELARSAIERLLIQHIEDKTNGNGNGHDPDLAARLERLSSRVAVLVNQVARLNRMVREPEEECMHA